MLQPYLIFRLRRAIPLIAMMGVGLVLLSSDLYIPIMPSMAHAFQANSDLVQLTLSAQFLGTSIFSMLAGPVSDYMGRRYVMIVCLLTFLTCAVGCALAQNIYMLILCRFLQGCGASGIMVNSMAIVKDIFPPLRSLKIISSFALISVLSPAIGPILGGHITGWFGWRAVFYTICIFAFIVTSLTVLFLPETDSKTRNLKEPRLLREFSLKKVWGNYQQIYTNTKFLKNAIAHGSMFGGKWCFLAVAPFVYIDTLHISKEVFGYYLSVFAVSFAIFHYCSKVLLKYITQIRLMQFGLLSGLLSSLLFIYVACMHPTSPIAISAVASLYFGSIAWVAPPAAALALSEFSLCKGSAASAVANLRTMMGFIGATAGSIIVDNGFVAVGIFMALTVLAPLFFTINAKIEN